MKLAELKAAYSSPINRTEHDRSITKHSGYEIDVCNVNCNMQEYRPPDASHIKKIL